MNTESSMSKSRTTYLDDRRCPTGTCSWGGDRGRNRGQECREEGGRDKGQGTRDKAQGAKNTEQDIAGKGAGNERAAVSHPSALKSSKLEAWTIVKSHYLEVLS